MAAIARWVYSFFTVTKVKVDNVAARKLYCGEKILFCSIVLTGSKSEAAFTNYHQNDITVFPEHGSVCNAKFELCINGEDKGRLDVYCVATRVGRAQVKLDLGKWYTIVDQSEFSLVFQPSCPAKLTITKFNNVLQSEIACSSSRPSYMFLRLNKINFIAKTSEDPNFTPDPEVLYDNQWSTLEANIVDEYENVVTCFDGNKNIRLELVEQGNKTDVTCKDAAIKNGVLRVKLKAEGVGQRDLSVILVNKNRSNDELLLEKLQLDICHPPISSAQSFCRKFSPRDCSPSAGLPFIVEIEINDVFGEPIHPEHMPSISASLNKVIQNRVHSTDSHNKKLLEITEARAGSQLVHILLNDRIIPTWDFNVHIVASHPKYLHFLKVVCLPKDSAFKPVGNTLYYGAWSSLEAVFTDEYGNVAKQVTGTEHYEVRLEAFDNKGSQVLLEWKNAKIDNGNVCVEVQPKQVGQLQLILRLSDKRNPNEELDSMTTTIDVCDSPCRGDYTDVEEFSVDVEKAPLDYQRCTVNWSPEFNDLEDQPLFIEDEQFKCVVQLKDIHNNNYIIDGDESVDLSVTCGNKQAAIQEQTILGLGALKATVPLINFQIHSGATTEFCFILNGHELEVPVRLTFVGFLNYNDSQCHIRPFHRDGDTSSSTSVIECKDVTEREIRGEDNCHLQNIRRICNSKDSRRIEVKQNPRSALLILPQSYSTNEQARCRETVLHLVKGLYYRQQASEADKEREKWRDHAKENYNQLKSTNKHGEKPTFCRKIKERYAIHMRTYNRKACEEMFAFHNLQRDQNEIDLHGLLVTDEEKLNEHEMQLEIQGKAEDEVERIIEEERKEGDEAIRKLTQRLQETFDMAKAKNDRKTWLEVIVGAGHHSKVRGRQKIRPKVEKYLNEEMGGFSVVNKGALVVTFEDYRGTGRCFGEYYCQRCQNAWKSGKSWNGKYQGCYGCYRENKTIQKCYPLKQRPLEKGLRHKSGQTGYTTRLAHSAKFCEKCTELGYPCYNTR